MKSRFGKFIKETPIIAISVIILGISILLMLTAVPVAYWPHYSKSMIIGFIIWNIDAVFF